MSYDEADYPWEVRQHPNPRETLFILERAVGQGYARFDDQGLPFPTRESAQRKADELNRQLGMTPTDKPVRYCVHGLRENQPCLRCNPWRRQWYFES